MKKNLTITVSIASFLLSACNNDCKPQGPIEKEFQEEQRNTPMSRSTTLYNPEMTSASNDITSNPGTSKDKSPTHVQKGKATRGGFGHGGGVGCGG